MRPCSILNDTKAGAGISSKNAFYICRIRVCSSYDSSSTLCMSIDSTGVNLMLFASTEISFGMRIPIDPYAKRGFLVSNANK